MSQFFIISAGSIIGSLIRWKINNIYLVNILGCFILGFAKNLNISKKLKLFICFSLSGSLTTFSGWIFDLFQLIRKDLYLMFFFNIGLLLILGYFAVYLGDFLYKRFID
tara:strand:- start:234 stop:560 length:327 start_codon:yes stop_codon:yes gene_type:complete